MSIITAPRPRDLRRSHRDAIEAALAELVEAGADAGTILDAARYAVENCGFRFRDPGPDTQEARRRSRAIDALIERVEAFLDDAGLDADADDASNVANLAFMAAARATA